MASGRPLSAHYKRCALRKSGALPPQAHQTHASQMLFAKEYGYEVLFSSEKNPYGAYLDFFEPHAPAHCRITPEMYQLDGTTELQKVTAEARRASDSAPNPSDTPRIRSSSGE